MKRIARLALSALVSATLLVPAGCATVTKVENTVGNLIPDPSQPILVPLEEMQILYARGLRNAMAHGGFEGLNINTSEKVWVVGKNSGDNSDVMLDAITYDALVDALRSQGVSEIVERDDDLMRAMYLEYTESAHVDAREDGLSKSGKLQSADVILAYRVMRLNYRSPGLVPLVIRFVVGVVKGLFGDAQVQLTDALRLAVHLDVIEAKTGTVRATKIIEHVEPQPEMFARDQVFSEAATSPTTETTVEK